MKWISFTLPVPIIVVVCLAMPATGFMQAFRPTTASAQENGQVKPPPPDTLPGISLTDNPSSERPMILVENSNAPWFSATAAMAASTNSAMPALTFGSQAVLDRCWTADELRGKSEIPAKGTVPGGQGPSSPRRLLPLCSPGLLRPELHGSIRAVEVPADKGKPVAFTFDLCEANGETSGYDADIINILRTHKVKATFFAGGKWMRSHPDRTQQLMADPLFEIGNHSWSHTNFAHLSEDQIDREVLWAQAQYEALREELQTRNCALEAGRAEMEKIPRVPELFRFPYGACTSVALRVVTKCGLPAIQWSIVTGDAATFQTAAGIVRIVQQQIRPGAIIIAHANGRGHGTAAALERLIPELRKNGYQFVTVSELLASGKVIRASECYENRPHDNRRYNLKSTRRKP
jgi:peptidoglycan-N-acetylglucosamine deacetylase